MSIVNVDGQLWFVAVDICETLGLEQVTRVVSRMNEDEARLLKVTHPQNAVKSIIMNAVKELVLYRLILSSNQPEAKLFRRWITHEVIPALRKTGGYQMPEMQAGRGQLLQFSRRDLLKRAVEADWGRRWERR